MTVERLEDLAVFMEAEAEWARTHGTPAMELDYLDLARCARAWVTLEKLSTDVLRGWSWDSTGERLVSLPTYPHSTAIEAVEAAGGGK